MKKISGKFDWVFPVIQKLVSFKIEIKKVKDIKKFKSKLMLDATASVGLEENHDLADVIGLVHARVCLV